MEWSIERLLLLSKKRKLSFQDQQTVYYISSWLGRLKKDNFRLLDLLASIYDDNLKNAIQFIDNLLDNMANCVDKFRLGFKDALRNQEKRLIDEDYVRGYNHGLKIRKVMSN